MAKRGKKLTPLQSEFKKQQKRIQNFIRRAEKRGYHFENNLIPEMPKRVTRKALEDIKNIQAPYLYNRSTFYDESSPTPIKGRERRKTERRLAGFYANYNKNINRIMRNEGVDREEASDIYKREREYKRKLENDAWARDHGYDSWEDMEIAQDERAREQEIIKPKYVEQEIVVPVERPKPDFHVETPEEKQERLLRELAEVQEEIKAKQQNEPIDLEDNLEKSEFWKTVEEERKKREEGARDRYYNTSGREPEKEFAGQTEKTDTVLQYIESEIATWQPNPNWSSYWGNTKEADKDNLNAMLRNAIESEGRENVAARLEAQAEYALSLADQICYGSNQEGTSYAFTEFSAIIMGRKLTFAENAMMTLRAEEGGTYN